MCRLLVGLADIDVVGVIRWTAPMEGSTSSPRCPVERAACGTEATIKETRKRRLVDLPCFGTPTVLVWHQVRWRCPDRHCPVGSWSQRDERLVVGNRGMTDRAARWATEQVGRHGRSVTEVADDLGCHWHTVNRAVIAYEQRWWTPRTASGR